MNRQAMIEKVCGWQAELREMIELTRNTERELVPLLKSHEKALHDFVFLLQSSSDERAGDLFEKAEPLGVELARKIEKIRDGIRSAKI